MSKLELSDCDFADDDFLFSCPFCGGFVKMKNKKTVWIECKPCGLYMMNGYDSDANRGKLLERWNKRKG